MKRPTFVQTFLITISGAALAFFGCLGFLFGIGGSSSGGVVPALGGIAIGLGMLMLLFGVAGMMVVLIRTIIRSLQNPSLPSDSGYPPSSRHDGTQGDSNDPPA